MKAKLFLANLKIKPVLYAIAVLCVAVMAANQYISRRSKPANNPWIVGDVISGDRFIVQRNDQTLEVKLCGISEGSKDSLRSLISQGDGSVILDRVSKQDGLTVAEVFVQRHDQQEIHLNTEMLMGGQAILADYKACPNAEYFEMAAAITQCQASPDRQTRNIVDIKGASDYLGLGCPLDEVCKLKIIKDLL